jgi:hypothetical protein
MYLLDFKVLILFKSVDDYRVFYSLFFGKEIMHSWKVLNEEKTNFVVFVRVER